MEEAEEKVLPPIGLTEDTLIAKPVVVLFVLLCCYGFVHTGASQLNIVTFIPFLAFQFFLGWRNWTHRQQRSVIILQILKSAQNWIITESFSHRGLRFFFHLLFYLKFNICSYRKVFISFIMCILSFYCRQVNLRWCHSEFMNNICFACPDHSQLFV